MRAALARAEKARERAKKELEERAQADKSKREEAETKMAEEKAREKNRKDTAAAAKDAEEADKRSREAAQARTQPNRWHGEGQPVGKAVLSTEAPGKQTVPIAETWGIRGVMQLWPGGKPLTIVTDASYVVKGLLHHSRAAYLKDSNGDIWGIIYEVEAKMVVKPTVNK